MMTTNLAVGGAKDGKGDNIGGGEHQLRISLRVVESRRWRRI